MFGRALQIKYYKKAETRRKSMAQESAAPKQQVVMEDGDFLGGGDELIDMMENNQENVQVVTDEKHVEVGFEDMHFEDAGGFAI